MRKYHTLSHIVEMLKEFDEFRMSNEFHLIDPDVFEMAIWYHDSVYDPMENDNEEESAKLFRTIARNYHLPANYILRVVRAILATRHSATSDDFNDRVLCDIDLSILGKPKTVFVAYEKAIREEYEWVVVENEFRVGRVAVLQNFINRPSIYSTEFFRKKFNDQAKENLARSIAQLSGS